MMNEVGKSERRARPEDPSLTRVVEWLTGLDAVRTGLFDVYVIEGPSVTDSVGECGELCIVATEGNVDDVEMSIRAKYGQLFPDVFMRR